MNVLHQDSWCHFLMQALFAEDTETKLSVQISKRKLILKAVGDDPPTQMAQLLALEYLVGVTDPDRLNQVSPSCCQYHCAHAQFAPFTQMLVVLPQQQLSQ